jgi:hypothetical protein
MRVVVMEVKVVVYLCKDRYCR